MCPLLGVLRVHCDVSTDGVGVLRVHYDVSTAEGFAYLL